MITTLTAEPVLQAKSPLGEGAIWDADRNVLYWVDIHRGEVHTFDPATGKDEKIVVGEPVGTVVKRSAKNGGGFVVGLPERFAHLSLDGKITTLAEMEKSAKTRSNDGKCDPAGRFWCGSMHFDFIKGAAHLWRLDADHTLHHMRDDITCSNGIVWTRDAKTMYYTDTPTGHMDSFDYDIETGNITNHRIAFKNEWGGGFDGMTIDASDHLYICAWGGSAVYRVEPRSGKLIAKIEIPGVRNITSCAFGGPNLQDLYITTSAAKAKDDEFNAGALFKITLKDTQGVKATEFAG